MGDRYDKVWRMQSIEIRVKGRIDEHWSDWFDGLTIAHTDQDETILTGCVVDQTALYSVLTKLRNLGLPLVSVNPSETADQEEPVP
jgi:hypothetical protein